jgi:hypothetical protein
MPARSHKQGDRLGDTRHGRRAPLAIALLAALAVVAVGCSSVLARLPKEITLPAGPTSAAASVTPAPAPAPAAAARPDVQPLTVLPIPDWDIPDGHFYTQTNGQPQLTSPTGFAVTNQDGAPFWNEYQRLGGPSVVGFPLSPRLAYQGKVTQVFQRAALQWNPQSRRVEPMNLLQALDDAGKGVWLAQTYKVPARLPGSFDQGKPPDLTVQDRLALLKVSPALEGKFRSAPDPLGLYGLPDSLVVDQGDSQAIRTQRTVLRVWKQDKPFAKAGEATADSSGEWLVQSGLLPREELSPEQPASIPVSLDLAHRSASPASSAAPPAAPAPTPVATPASTVTTWQVAADGDGVFLRRTPRLDDKIRAWADGTPLKGLGEQAQGDSLTWQKVQAPDGTVGWVPVRYLRPVR